MVTNNNDDQNIDLTDLSSILSGKVERASKPTNPSLDSRSSKPTNPSGTALNLDGTEDNKPEPDSLD